MEEKKTITQEDLDLNPELVEQGVKVGDEIELGPACNEDGTVLDKSLDSANDESAADGETDIVGGREKDDR